MRKNMNYPFQSEELLKKSKKIRRELLEDGTSRIRKNIAVLGGSTTHDIIRIMEIFLLQQGIEPVFYESEYDRYYEDAMFGNPELDAFNPDVIYIHTSFRNLLMLDLLPSPGMPKETAEELPEKAYARFVSMWDKLAERCHCPVIQNNFEYPPYRLMGNREASDIRGRVRFVNRLNEKFAAYADSHESFYINDLNYLAAQYGLDAWQDDTFWNMYKYALSMQAIPILAFSVSNIIKSVYGKNRKALALDLDNTLWGGIVGDDGVEDLEIGQETAMGEVFHEFQTYLKELKEIGVLLTVDSKNDEKNAIDGLRHPAGVLRPEDFVDIRANWEPKSRNLSAIAEDLNILPEAMVFVDDNPAEREIVRQQVPGAAVPEMTAPEQFIRTIDHCGYFEVTTLSEDDARRTDMYRANAARRSAEEQFEDYGSYLRSLEMKAEIVPFEKLNYPRITQLTNKSNQFNLTTKRYSEDQIEEAAEDPDTITLCGRLSDRFGDNGIVSLIIGSVAMTVTEESGSEKGRPTGIKALLIDLWLMSCRVLKRDMEYAMMDALVGECRRNGIREIYGYYYPTAKNAMVKEFYAGLGFRKISEDKDGNTVWKFMIPNVYTNRNRYITVKS